MQISHDYVIRFLGTSIMPPRAKPEVTTVIFNTITNTAGGHQKMIDISRCSLIEPVGFECFSCCEALLFLDLSFTVIDSLSCIADSCLALRALNIAHCMQLTDFTPLAKMVTLQLLNLRSTGFTNSELLHDLVLLRSLDMAHTQISSIRPLHPLYRLEELLLDGCELLCVGPTVEDIETQRQITTQAQSELLSSLLELKPLRLLNIGETGLAETWKENYLLQCHIDLCLETKSRR
jgi:hypothetical protein